MWLGGYSRILLTINENEALSFTRSKATQLVIHLLFIIQQIGSHSSRVGFGGGGVGHGGGLRRSDKVARFGTGCFEQVRDGLALDALKVNMPTLCLLLLPRHVQERTLHVVVNHFRSRTSATSHLLLVSWIT